jgi:hypothetical protein
MTWTIKLVNGSEHQFVDLQQVVGQYYELQAGYIHQLQSNIRKASSYSVHTSLIETTKGPKKNSLKAPFLLLIITKTGLTVTFLGELTEDDAGYIVGVWPENFLSILKQDNDAILKLLFIITNQPALIKKLDLYF